ncbi:hypothetical protein Lalb_Chr17g0343141 [Lupinus albus]|uniref:Uncharacterized protein n=1 Tax=Lupinus albus TaxID=3870 RepID=A0A6A4P342_LUPAL|nr:hypothetical protein Lalb_Chr17g0343141 [Lupinus albus]
MEEAAAVNKGTPLTLFCFNLLHPPPYSILPFLRSLSPLAATTVERNDNHCGEFTVSRLLPLSPPTSDGDNGS